METANSIEYSGGDATVTDVPMRAEFVSDTSPISELQTVCIIV